MNKILLVYEDYADLMSAEAALKKVGFDVIGLSSEYSVAEQMLAFNPDLVVAAGRGGKVSALGVGKRLKEMSRWSGKSVLIFPANFKPNPQDLIRIRVDMVLEAPVSPQRLVQVVGKILGHDEVVLMERLNKVAAAEASSRPGGVVGGRPLTEEEAIYVKGTSSAAAEEGGTETPRGTSSSEEDSQDFSLSHQESERKVSFRFGDRMSEGSPEATKEPVASSEDVSFAPVDLSALEKELLGGGIPDVERVEEPTSSVPVEEEAEAEAETETETERARRQLEQAQEKIAERVSKYKNLVADVKVSPKSTLPRVEVRRRQRQLAADWDRQANEELDELRRQFAKALFKK